MAPDAGFEPATKRLTAAYSTAELIRNLKKRLKNSKEIKAKFYEKIALMSRFCATKARILSIFASQTTKKI